MKRALITAAILFVPAFASADNIGGCGWGSKLMDGNRGIAPQILAVTTNGFLGNQTFGISSGTSGCSQDGVVKSNWKLAALIDENKSKLARDVSVGSGETLDSVATLLGVEQSDRAEFQAVAKSNFSKLFPTSGVASADVISSLRDVLAQNERLAKYAAAV